MNDVLKEIQQRVVRIETRLTKFLKAQDEEVPTQKVWFSTKTKRLMAPSPDVSLRDVCEAIRTQTKQLSADVYVGDDFQCRVSIDGPWSSAPSND